MRQNKNSAIADKAAQTCTTQIVAVECRVPVLNALFLSNLTIASYTAKNRLFGLHICHT